MVDLPPLYADAIQFSFGDSPELADELLALVLAGKKTATCGALRDYGPDREPMPEAGRRDVVINGAGEPACVIETLSVETMRFDDVDPDFTDREGEGDYAAWREGHERYFARNGGFAPDMELVCETFRLVTLLREEGYAAVVSGAGPSVLVLDAGPEDAALVRTVVPAGWEVLDLAVEASGARVRYEDRAVPS